MLYLFLSLDIKFESELARARITYDTALQQNPREPSLDNLIAQGWIRVIWGRISIPFEVAQAARSYSETMTAFISMLVRRDEQIYCLAAAVCTRPDLVPLVKEIENGNMALRDIGCQTPEWVAARLWEQNLCGRDSSTRIRVWLDRWIQLGFPSLVPSRAWNESVANEFREASMGVLHSDPSLVGWDAMRVDLVKQKALFNKTSSISVEDCLPQVPATLVDRALWLEGNRLDHVAMDMLDGYGDFHNLIYLLLSDVEVDEHAPVPHKKASNLFSLATKCPVVFYAVFLYVRKKPKLLADLLLYPETSALACLIAGSWRLTSSAWDRELTTRDDQATKIIAFADAVSVMGHFLRIGSTPPEEVSALLIWLHSSAQPGFIDDIGHSEVLLTTLRAELMSQSAETLHAMVNGMASAMTAIKPYAGPGNPLFAAILDLVDIGKLAGEIDPEPLVEAYVDAIAAGDYTLSAHRVGTGGAASLFELATRSYPALYQKFLSPLDIKTRFATGEAAGENPFTVADTIVRSIRAHIRMLCRAMLGWREAIPSDMIEALIIVVRAGALAHKEKGRVAAFTPRNEQNIFGGSLDRPIAADLGAALRSLNEEAGDRLLVAILETDEPLVLAQLLAFAPHGTRARIRQRIDKLTPDEAGDIRSLTEVQARIEALLSAAAPNAAALFIENERKIKTIGSVPGREISRLRVCLRLQLLRNDWVGILKTPIPPEFSPADHQSAMEIIDFYKGIAYMKMPDGNLDLAEGIFVRLHVRHPDVIAYSMNLLASRISKVLENDLFARLHGASLQRAQQILIEADQMIRQAQILATTDSEAFLCNKALLMLAIGQSYQVVDMLTPLQGAYLQDTIAAYKSVALSRMGRSPEALSTLDDTERVLGSTDVLRAAREYIGSGTPFDSVAVVSSVEDPLPRVKRAISELKQMDSTRQAEVLMPQPEPFDALVVEYVRSAAASVVALVPMMKNVTIDSCEDDLTALIRELLVARLHFLGWSLADQSKAGFTAKENPGEPDLLLKYGSTTLAVMEAVVCNRPVNQEWTRKELASHFQKLLAYSTCHLFFYVIYAYIEDQMSVMRHLEQMVKNDAPQGFEYHRYEPIAFTDSRPTGLIARYLGGSGEVKVVFLVLNMGQNRQKQAAKMAAISNPRRSKDNSSHAR
jgi:hypothetical protein